MSRRVGSDSRDGTRRCPPVGAGEAARQANETPPRVREVGLSDSEMQPGSAVEVPEVGWTGRCYEDFRVGAVYQHRLGRTVTTTDNMWFTHLTLNSNPIHFDHYYASRTEFGRPLVNSCFTISLVSGMSVQDVSQNVLANLGWDEVRLPNPVFEGDTLYAESDVLDMRASKSRPNVGIVSIHTRGYNQDGKTVIEFKRTMLVYRRGHVPEPPRPARTEPPSGARFA